MPSGATHHRDANRKWKRGKILHQPPNGKHSSCAVVRSIASCADCRRRCSNRSASKSGKRSLARAAETYSSSGSIFPSAATMPAPNAYPSSIMPGAPFFVSSMSASVSRGVGVSDTDPREPGGGRRSLVRPLRPVHQPISCPRAPPERQEAPAWGREPARRLRRAQTGAPPRNGVRQAGTPAACRQRRHHWGS